MVAGQVRAQPSSQAASLGSTGPARGMKRPSRISRAGHCGFGWGAPDSGGLSHSERLAGAVLANGGAVTGGAERHAGKPDEDPPGRGLGGFCIRARRAVPVNSPMPHCYCVCSISTIKSGPTDTPGLAAGVA